MSKLITLAVDAHGGDNAPDCVLSGVEIALSEDPSLNILLCGKPEVVDPFCASHERCTAVHASQVIGMDEHPADAVKAKKDSSIVVGCMQVKEGKADGFFSAGSTGACLVAATLKIGRIKGVKRPALGVIIPAYKKPTFLLDVGANADCKVEYFPQFASMGTAYMRSVMGVQNPTVGLLNIGAEETKGSLFSQEAYQMMREQVPNFEGNCEGGALLQGDFDVVVTDGFTGNVCLKTIEGTSKTLFRYLKDAFMSGIKEKIGALLVKGKLKDLKVKVSPDTYGGSPLLGVKGVVIVGHGSSGPEAIKNGIATSAHEARQDIVSVIANMVGQVS